MSQPTISIIIPCYNYGQFLAEALGSVEAQTFPDWECIVVDNASTDNTRDVAQGFVKKDPRFKYIYTENKGVSTARNLGIRNTTGKYILPLDADDKIGNGYIKEGCTILESHPQIKIVYCDVELFGEINRKWQLPDHSLKQMLVENTIFSSGIYRREDYLSTNGYDETMYNGLEDWEFWISLLKNGGDVYKIPAVHFYYRIRKTSRNNSLDNNSILAIRHYIYEKHKALFDLTFTIPELLFELSEVERKMDALKGSREFKTGNLLLFPFRSIQSLLKSDD
jgi:glycosyltransferase involved in cell wall biosynthesis